MKIGHGLDWAGQDVTGWLASEKLDGCRAVWDGRNLWTRQEKLISAPPEILSELPEGVALDGEIWAGRGTFDIAQSAVQRNENWDKCSFIIFDMPFRQGTWDERLKQCRSILDGASNAHVINEWRVSCMEQLADYCERIQSNGGEGIVVRDPSLKFYPQSRGPHTLKVKSVSRIREVYCPVASGGILTDKDNPV